MLTDQAQVRFVLKHDDETDYGGATMPDKNGSLFGGSFTSHCTEPMWTSNPDAAGKGVIGH